MATVGVKGLMYSTVDILHMNDRQDYRRREMKHHVLNLHKRQQLTDNIQFPSRW